MNPDAPATWDFIRLWQVDQKWKDPSSTKLASNKDGLPLTPSKASRSSAFLPFLDHLQYIWFKSVYNTTYSSNFYCKPKWKWISFTFKVKVAARLLSNFTIFLNMLLNSEFSMFSNFIADNTNSQDQETCHFSKNKLLL